jgi:hypothetical protein
MAIGLWTEWDNMQNVCVCVLLRDFGSYGKIFVTVFTTVDFSVDQFTIVRSTFS